MDDNVTNTTEDQRPVGRLDLLYIIGRFRFTLLSRSPEPQHLLFDKRWYMPVLDQPISLL